MKVRFSEPLHYKLQETESITEGMKTRPLHLMPVLWWFAHRILRCANVWKRNLFRDHVLFLSLSPFIAIDEV